MDEAERELRDQYERLTRGLSEVLAQPSPHAARLVDRLKRSQPFLVAQLKKIPKESETRKKVAERFLEIQNLLNNPLQLYILMQADVLNLDAADPVIQKRLEIKYHQAHIPSAAWSLSSFRKSAQPRAHARFYIARDASVAPLSGGDAAPVYTQDISLGGAKLIGAPPGFKSGEIKLTLYIPREGKMVPLETEAKIAWRNKFGEIGVRFTELPDGAAQTLSMHLSQEFEDLGKRARRYAELAPDDLQAQISHLLIRYFGADEKDTNQEAHYLALAELTRKHPDSRDAAFAYAKVALDRGENAVFKKSMKDLRSKAPNDPRLAELTGFSRSTAPKVAGLRLALPGMNTPVIRFASLLVVLGACGGFFWEYGRNDTGNYRSADVRLLHAIPCIEYRRQGDSLMCLIESQKYESIRQDARQAKADITLEKLNAKRIIVYGNEKLEVLDRFGDLLP